MQNQTLRNLRILNFSTLLKIDHADPGEYSFADYRGRNFQHPGVVGYCTSCDDASVHEATDGSGFTLRNMSHGAHSVDFLQSFTDAVDTSAWHDAGVLFVFESPSVNYGDLYDTVQYNGRAKRPTREWYWVHRDHAARGYPDSFCGGTYGDLVRSAMLTFRLGNAYVTNLVKCGLNNAAGNEFRSLATFPEGCIRSCYEKLLSREIEILQPRVAFAFGTAVYDWLRVLVDPSVRIQQLPHPAGRRRGLRDEHYEALYLWLMARALAAEGVLSTEELGKYVPLFVEHAPPRRPNQALEPTA